jgi:hypothetical protein
LSILGKLVERILGNYLPATRYNSPQTKVSVSSLPFLSNKLFCN